MSSRLAGAASSSSPSSKRDRYGRSFGGGGGSSSEVGQQVHDRLGRALRVGHQIGGGPVVLVGVEQHDAAAVGARQDPADRARGVVLPAPPRGPTNGITFEREAPGEPVQASVFGALGALAGRHSSSSVNHVQTRPSSPGGR